MIPWLTRGGNNLHSQWNNQETLLTQQSVIQKGVSLQPRIPVIGDARGMEGQPLIFTKVPVPTTPQATMSRDVMILPSMANVVRGVDAHTGAGIWQTYLGLPAKGSRVEDVYLINDNWGCLNTGAGDKDTNRIYLTCQVSTDGSFQNSRYWMFELDVATGRILSKTQYAGTMSLQNSDVKQDFNVQWRKIRAGSVLLNQNGIKTIFTCGGSVYMTKAGVAGFCSDYDIASHMFVHKAITNGGAANVWMSGGAPAVLPNGHIIFVTATGRFDGVSQLAESVIEATYDPVKHDIEFIDHFTPYRDRVRTQQDPQGTYTKNAPVAGRPDMVAGMNPSTNSYGKDVPVNGHGMSMPNLTHYKIEAGVDPQGHIYTLALPNDPIAAGNWADEDLGSSQQAVVIDPSYFIPSLAKGLALVTGKDGITYSVKIGNMGNTSIADLANPKANCTTHLAAYPIFATSYTGKDACPTNDTDLNFLVNGQTVHEHAPATVFWNPLLENNTGAYAMTVWGENSPMKEYEIHKDGSLTFVAQTTEIASPDSRTQPGGGMTGGFCQVSSNGRNANSYIEACSVPYGDANKTVTNGRLLIFDPVHTSNGIIPAIWDSARWNIGYTFNKFMPPVIDGGEIILPDYSGSVMIFK